LRSSTPLRFYSGSIKALSRLYSGSIQALFRLYSGSIKGLLRLQLSIKALYLYLEILNPTDHYPIPPKDAI
jgi:hypothetical protein